MDPIIAAHAASLGCKNVKLISVTGKDEIKNFTKDKSDVWRKFFSLKMEVDNHFKAKI